MRRLVFISYILLLTGLLAEQAGLVFAQEYKPYNTFNKETELSRFIGIEQGGKVEEISPNIYKLTYKTGESRVFKFSKRDEFPNPKENITANNEPVDTTIINIWEIDTTKFAGMFTFWQQVQVSNSSWAPLPIEDLNNNGRPELYGFTNTVIPNFQLNIYERNLSGIYQNIFTYDSQAVFVKGVGDIKDTEQEEIVIYYFEENDSVSYHYSIYKSDSMGALPTTFDFIFYFDGYQINDMIFDDFDNNGITDCAFTIARASIPPMSIVAEFRDSINNFQELFRFSSLSEDGIAGFAINNFDKDKRIDLVFSTAAGNVFIIENESENEYSIVNQFPFPSYNAYMQTATNDIDKNGKPEFWIGGQDFEEGVTIFQSYEADDDNSYKIVTRIELRYLVSFYNYFIQAVDIDNDGKDELIISIGNVILILKFVGSPNNHQYKLWYAKFGEATQPGAQFNPVSVADLNDDEKKDLLIPMEKYTPSVYYAFSYILKQDKPSGIVESLINKKSLEFIQSYPNPFNSVSTISFNITESSNVQLKIFNSLGKEIIQLLDKQLSPGNYNISWDAKDKPGNSLPSGVYLIVLKTKNTVKTFKSLLLK